MNKKVFISLIIFFFIHYNVCAANTKPSGLLEVDFGSVQAMKTVHQVRNFTLPVKTGQPKGVAIETAGLINYQNNERIPSERITFQLKGETMVMATSSLVMDFDGKPIDKQIEIKFDLGLEPIDHPGLYQGIIQFRFWEMNQNQVKWLDPIQVSLKVEVESWISLKTDAKYINLEPQIGRNTRNLINTEPLQIKVASNSNWQLGINITSKKMPSNISFLVSVDDISKQFQGTGQTYITVQDKKVIATGSATVTERNYECDIPVEIYLNDYTLYQTSSYQFKVQFMAEVFE